MSVINVLNCTIILKISNEIKSTRVYRSINWKQNRSCLFIFIFVPLFSHISERTKNRLFRNVRQPFVIRYFRYFVSGRVFKLCIYSWSLIRTLFELSTINYWHRPCSVILYHPSRNNHLNKRTSITMYSAQSETDTHG